MLAVALFLAQVLDVSAGQLPDPPPAFPFTSDAGIDIGCSGGGSQGSRFPGRAFDASRRETLLYNVSRCTGGFIRGTQDATGRAWSVEIGPTGAITGRDLDGRDWRYDRPSASYVVRSTGATCARADWRHMCAPAAG